MEMIFADFLGSMKYSSPSGSRYCKAPYEDANVLSILRLISSKADAKNVLKDVMLELESILKSENRNTKYENPMHYGGEFLTTQFKNCVSQKVTVHGLNPICYPKSNTKAKILNKPILEVARNNMSEI